jgi:hypothetical protein
LRVIFNKEKYKIGVVARIHVSVHVKSNTANRLEMEKLEYYAFEINKSCPINLGIEVNPYPNTQEGLEMNNISKTGVRWLYKDVEIKLEDEFYVPGYPSVDNESFVAIYSSNSKIIVKPNNAIIYNSDGSIRTHIKMPNNLLSSNAIRINPPLIDWSFIQANWYINSKRFKVVGIWIGFARGKYFEIRELDTDTGLIGELISYGRM